MKISYRVPQYAPELATFCVDGKVFASRYSQLAHDLGCLVIEGKQKEALDRIKREVRKGYRERKRVTFGFFEKGTNRFFYTSMLTAFDDDLQDKLRVFKEWKRFCLSQNCVMNTHEIASGEVSPDGVSKPTVTVVEEIADLTRPVKLRVIERR